MEIFSGKDVLITGASGLIGSHLARALYMKGARVHATRHINEVSPNYIAYDVDIRNQSDMEWLIDTVRPDFVFHLAASAIVGASEIEVVPTFTTDVIGTVNLLHALRMPSAAEVKSVVVASTDKVYGRHRDLPYTEEHELRGNYQVYETAKLCADKIAQMAAIDWDLPIAITRCGNVYGPGDLHWDRLIPGTIASYISHTAPQIRSNGQYYRDYVHVSDIVRGYMMLAEYRSSFAIPKTPVIANLGSGKPFRVLDIVTMIGSQFPDIISPTIYDQVPDEIKSQYVDSTHAKNLFGWKSEISISEGLMQTIEWYKGYLK